MKFADPVDRLGNGIRMQCREDKVSGLRGLHRGLGRRMVPYLADEDDLGVLADRGADGVRERVRVDPDFPLLELALVFDEEVFDRVLDGDDPERGGFVEPLEQRADGGALALAGGARHEKQAAGFLDEVGQARRQTEIRQLWDSLRHDAEGKRLGALLFAERGPVAQPVAEEAEIHLVLVLDAVADRGGERRAEHGHDIVVGRGGEHVGRDAKEASVHAIGVAAVRLGVQIRRGLTHAPVQQAPQ